MKKLRKSGNIGVDVKNVLEFGNFEDDKALIDVFKKLEPGATVDVTSLEKDGLERMLGVALGCEHGAGKSRQKRAALGSEGGCEAECSGGTCTCFGCCKCYCIGSIPHCPTCSSSSSQMMPMPMAAAGASAVGPSAARPMAARPSAARPMRPIG